MCLQSLELEILFYLILIFFIAFVIPYGVAEFFNYVGLDLFALCTIGCVKFIVPTCIR